MIDNVSVPVCGQVQFFDPSGTISSPNYPSDYPISTTCTYVIELYQYNKITITFIEVALEESYDYVQV